MTFKKSLISTKRCCLSAFTILACCLVAAQANGDLITSASDLISPTVIDFEQFAVQESVGTGIQVGDTVGEDVFLTAVGDHRVGPMAHGLDGNGTWNRSGALNNDNTSGTMTFTFNDGPVRGVGGFVNYAVPGYGDYFMEALDSGGSVLESYNISVVAPISTPGGFDDGEFRGILRDSNDIHALRLSFAYNVIDDLSFSRIPEPSSTALLGVCLLGAWMRRRR